MIEKGQKLLLFRYSDFLIKNCIKLHQDVLEENGYVWFGKVGKQRPSQKFINYVLAEKEPTIILHSKQKAYICKIEDISYEQPEDNYPAYYQEVLFEKGNYPSAYIKIVEMKEIEKKVLSNFIVSSSRNDLTHALYSSTNSIFFLEAIKEVII